MYPCFYAIEYKFFSSFCFLSSKGMLVACKVASNIISNFNRVDDVRFSQVNNNNKKAPQTTSNI
jgi:hypothetical protein